MSVELLCTSVSSTENNKGFIELYSKASLFLLIIINEFIATNIVLVDIYNAPPTPHIIETTRARQRK